MLTWYGDVDDNLVKKAKDIKLLICDVDGVLSNGLIYIGNNGEELKTFHVRDGYGIRCLISVGIQIAIITGRHSNIVTQRAHELGIKHIYQGQSDKLIAYNQLIDSLAVEANQVAYIGDDMIDWPVMNKVGLSVAVEDAHPKLKELADYVTANKGGHGAVRELCDLILIAQRKMDIAEGLSI